jgi:REP element-mobilizing transposase RayT
MNFRKNSLRLKNYDYTQEGYFVTICTGSTKSILGKILNGQIILNEIGRMAKDTWFKLEEQFNDILLDEFVVMPNHIHGILLVIKEKDSRGLIHQTRIKRTLGEIIRNFKAESTYIIHKNGYKDFKWQRNYYDHIIRNQRDLENTQSYIFYNPQKGEFDKENPECKSNECEGSMNRTPTGHNYFLHKPLISIYLYRYNLLQFVLTKYGNFMNVIFSNFFIS